MTQEQQTILLIKGAITELPAAQAEACNELAEHIRQACKIAGEPVGTLALALVGAEAEFRIPWSVMSRVVRPLPKRPNDPDQRPGRQPKL